MILNSVQLYKVLNSFAIEISNEFVKKTIGVKCIENMAIGPSKRVLCDNLRKRQLSENVNIYSLIWIGGGGLKAYGILIVSTLQTNIMYKLIDICLS